MRGFMVFPVIDINLLSYMGDGERAKSSAKQRSFIYSLMGKANIDEVCLSRELGLRYGINQYSIKDAGSAIDYLKLIVYGG